MIQMAGLLWRRLPSLDYLTVGIMEDYEGQRSIAKWVFLVYHEYYDFQHSELFKLFLAEPVGGFFHFQSSRI